MKQPQPNIGAALVLLIVGTALVYYVARNNGLHAGASPQEIWMRLTFGLRAVVIAGFIASAYGLGALVSHLTRKSR